MKGANFYSYETRRSDQKILHLHSRYHTNRCLFRFLPPWPAGSETSTWCRPSIERWPTSDHRQRGSPPQWPPEIDQRLYRSIIIPKHPFRWKKRLPPQTISFSSSSEFDYPTRDPVASFFCLLNFSKFVALLKTLPTSLKSCC